MRENYKNPEVEFIVFTCEDVMTTSNPTDEEEGGGVE